MVELKRVRGMVVVLHESVNMIFLQEMEWNAHFLMTPQILTELMTKSLKIFFDLFSIMMFILGL